MITVTFGTVASPKAKSSFAPCLMMPPYSCPVPGRKPGTSTKVRIGISNASQNRTNRAALRAESMSRQPASTIGWFATTPTVEPSSRMNPVRMFLAKSAWISKKSPSSATFRISSFMS